MILLTVITLFIEINYTDLCREAREHAKLSYTLEISQTSNMFPIRKALQRLTDSQFNLHVFKLTLEDMDDEEEPITFESLRSNFIQRYIDLYRIRNSILS